jgi:two-component system OmpR family response regulator/two-component system KDP operon response regulator KdpE
MNMIQKRVLIVDDIEALRKQAIYSLSLIYPNVSFIEAENGYKAIDKIIKYKPDLMLLDIEMPDLDGIGVLERIRKSRDKKISSLPVIMFTGNVNKDVVNKILKLNVNDYLVKPFEIDTLLKKVDKFLKPDQK